MRRAKTRASPLLVLCLLAGLLPIRLVAGPPECSTLYAKLFLRSPPSQEIFQGSVKIGGKSIEGIFVEVELFPGVPGYLAIPRDGSSAWLLEARQVSVTKLASSKASFSDINPNLAIGKGQIIVDFNTTRLALCKSYRHLKGSEQYQTALKIWERGGQAPFGGAADVLLSISACTIAPAAGFVVGNYVLAGYARAATEEDKN